MLQKASLNSTPFISTLLSTSANLDSEIVVVKYYIISDIETQNFFEIFQIDKTLCTYSIYFE